MTSKANLEGSFSGELLLRHEETNATPGRHSRASTATRFELVTIAVGRQGIRTATGAILVEHSANPTVGRLTRVIGSDGPWELRLHTKAIHNISDNFTLFTNSILTALGNNKKLNKRNNTLAFELNVNNFFFTDDNNHNYDSDNDDNNNDDKAKHIKHMRNCMDGFNQLWAQETDCSRTVSTRGSFTRDNPRIITITIK